MADPRRSRRIKRACTWLLYISLCIAYLCVAALAGFYIGYKADLPDVRAIEGYTPNLITEIYSDDNKLIGEFALERREVISVKAIPRILVASILSAEDRNFFNHPGVDFRGILRAAYKNWRTGKLVAGGSTLTQQLTRQLFLSSEKSFDRKIRELILAQEIETNFTKEQILALYCNIIYMGHSVYGFVAAADFYFGKSLDELELDECALLAALPKAPTKYSPYLNPRRALGRRNYVLDRMAADGFVTKEEADKAKRKSVVLRTHQKIENIAPHFLEMIRHSLARRYSTREIWGGGLRIYTTLNIEMQRAANEAVKDGLMQYEKRHGWRGPTSNILAENYTDLKSFNHDDWTQEPNEGSIMPGLVVAFDNSNNAIVKLGSCRALLTPEDIVWTERASPKGILQVGDLALFKITEIDDDNQICSVTLEQTPQVQGALAALDNSTGEIKALVGGYDYHTSEFNRATRSLRQPGSAFKPFVYTTALEAGLLAADRILDSPVSFRGANGKIWAPHNYDKKFKGPIAMGQALAESRNAATVRLAARVGIDNVIEMAHRFGITGHIDHYLPIALGSADVTLLELTSAYSVFPNAGAHAAAHFIRRIETYTGAIKEEFSTQGVSVIKPDIAEEMVEMLRGVVKFGTATKAQVLNKPVAGKTGTTNAFTDAWFIGFNLPSEPAKERAQWSSVTLDLHEASIPSLTVGVWVGFDDNRSLGEKETGSRAALPIWIHFMKKVYQRDD